MSDTENKPVVVMPDTATLQMHYCAIYCVLHHLASVVNATLEDVMQHKGIRKRAEAFEKRSPELLDAAQGLKLYDSTPPAEIAKTYEEFCRNIASTEHLRENERRLTNHLRNAMEWRAKVANAYGISREASAEEFVEELDRRAKRLLDLEALLGRWYKHAEKDGGSALIHETTVALFGQPEKSK